MMRNGGKQPKLLSLGFGLLIAMGFSQLAFAGLLYPGGLPHPDAIPGWSGTVPLVNSTNSLHYGDIEYAVFKALDFPWAEDTPNGGVAAGEFVYAFQVHNIQSTDITQFAAGLADLGPPLFPAHHGDGSDDNEEVQLGDQDYVPGTGQIPSSSQVTNSVLYGAANGSSVRFNFNSGPMDSRLNSGEWSAVLFYTSPWGPRWDNASTTTGAGQSRIPAPENGVIPEPSSVVLGSFGLLTLIIRGRRRVLK